MTTFLSPKDEVESNDVDSTATQAAFLENKALNTVDANDGDITDSYQGSCKSEVAVTSATVSIRKSDRL